MVPTTTVLLVQLSQQNCAWISLHRVKRGNEHQRIRPSTVYDLIKCRVQKTDTSLKLRICICAQCLLPNNRDLVSNVSCWWTKDLTTFHVKSARRKNVVPSSLRRIFGDPQDPVDRACGDSWVRGNAQVPSCS